MSQRCENKLLSRRICFATRRLKFRPTQAAGRPCKPNVSEQLCLVPPPVSGAVLLSDEQECDPREWLVSAGPAYSNLQSAIAVAVLSDQPVAQEDIAKAAKLCHHFNGPEARPHCGVVVEAKLLGLGRRQLQREVLALASAVYESSGALVGRFATLLKKAIDDKVIVPVAMVCGNYYDETPLSIRVEGQPQARDRDLRKVRAEKGVKNTAGRR